MDKAQRRLTKSLGWFAASGAIGFLVDATILTLLMGMASLSPIAARAISFPAAVTVTWLVNRRHAFAGRGLDNLRLEYSGYLAIQLVGALLNFWVFVACLKAWPPLVELPVVALAAGAAVAFAFNFAASQATLYSSRRTR